jgi:signal transduction histidine kinase
LEVTVDERTGELRETINQLESFSYTVAHDLRAPIRGIEGFSLALLEDYGSRLPAEAQHMLSNMARAARRLDALTKDVLNYTRLTTEELHLSPVDPAEVVQDVLIMNPALQPPAIVAVARPMRRVLANRTLLSQCFSNLLSNAVKFVKPGVTPHIVISSEEVNGPTPAQGATGQASPAGPGQSPRRVRLWVKDNGIGMDADTRQRIFGIFERGRGVNRIPGTGIGLAIFAKGVQRMGGTYGVESEPGEGSRFWMELTAA